MQTDRLSCQADSVLDFWLADGLARGWPSQEMKQRWFGGGAALDAEVKARFGPCVGQALAGKLQHWEVNPLTRLALVIVLDQFTRNVFRGSPAAFGGDTVAQSLVLRTLAEGGDRTLPFCGRVFMYMPLMHAEDQARQQQCVDCFAQLVAEAPPELKERLQGNLDFAQQHLDIIERFGRFPHRNAVLGRTSTPDEAAYLTDGPRFGQ
jgi:uncharacterized protein (DUF924 family)